MDTLSLSQCLILAHRPLNMFGTYSTCYNHIFQLWELQDGQYINWYQITQYFFTKYYSIHLFLKNWFLAHATLLFLKSLSSNSWTLLRVTLKKEGRSLRHVRSWYSLPLFQNELCCVSSLAVHWNLSFTCVQVKSCDKQMLLN